MDRATAPDARSCLAGRRSTSARSTPIRWSSSAGGTRTPPPWSTPPRPWPSPRPTPTAVPRCAWCCSSRGARDGFVFFTNYDGRKSHDLDRQSAGRAPLLLGAARPPGAGGGAGRAARRPRSPTPTTPPGTCGSRIGAHASHQSRPVADRAALDAAVDRWTAEFGDRGVPRPAVVGRLAGRPAGLSSSGSRAGTGSTTGCATSPTATGWRSSGSSPDAGRACRPDGLHGR